MSYARFGWEGSDVYVYLDVNGYLCCCGCSLGDKWDFPTTDAILDHLEKHRDAGHCVPDECVAELECDREGNDSFIASGGDQS